VTILPSTVKYVAKKLWAIIHYGLILYKL
jgi:hypothetical protein